MVPVDFSAHADRALSYAITIASRFDASVELLHVVDDPFLSGAWSSEVYVPNLFEVRDSMVEDAERRLAACRASLDDHGVPIVTTVEVGQPARTIGEHARANHSNLIVMGTHGRTGLAHTFMGSVAERVVRTAPCPVLTLKDTAVDAEKATTPPAKAVA
jgi:nucleotide-binding universal stress UspA family protein